MHQLLTLTGHIAAILGIVCCAGAGLARVSGLYYIAGFQSTSLFMLGTGIMVFACLVKLDAMRAHLR